MNPEISSSGRFVDRLARAKALDAVADAVQPALRRALEGAGPLAPLSDLLHGRPLGHSLHAAITDIPIGAWTTAALLDGLEVAGRDEFKPAADVAIGLGLAGGLGAIATGFAEWSDTSGEPKRLGAAHALCNTLGIGAYVASLALRRSGRRRAGIVSAMLGYGLSSFAAFLGGELSTGFQIGVKHTSPIVFPPEDFTAVMPANELTQQLPKRVDFAGIPLLLSRDEEGRIHAISAVCTHRGGPLERGTVADGCVTCPWHGARYDRTDGSVKKGPATFPLSRFATRVVGGYVEVRPAF